jgi:hypothetical protein
MPQARQSELVAARNAVRSFALRSLSRSLAAITIACVIAVGFHKSAGATVYDWTYSDLGASGSGTLTTGGPSGGRAHNWNDRNL